MKMKALAGFNVGMRIRVSDNTPRPPERFTKKLRAWKDNNYTGTIVELNEWEDGKRFVTSTRDDYPDRSGIVFRFTRPLNEAVQPLEAQ